MSSTFLYTFPSSSWIFFVVLTCFWWDVFLWKKVVFLSTYINHSTFNLCFQRTSSSLKGSSNSPSISTFVFVKKLTWGLCWILYSFFQSLLIFWDKFPNLCDPHSSKFTPSWVIFCVFMLLVVGRFFHSNLLSLNAFITLEDSFVWIFPTNQKPSSLILSPTSGIVTISPSSSKSTSFIILWNSSRQTREKTRTVVLRFEKNLTTHN